MGNVSLKVLERSLNFLSKKWYKLCLYLAQHLSTSDVMCYNLNLLLYSTLEL